MATGFRGARRGKGKRGKSAEAPGQRKKTLGLQSARTLTRGYKQSSAKAPAPPGEFRKPAASAPAVPGAFRKPPAVQPPAKTPTVGDASTAKPAGTRPSLPSASAFGQSVAAWARGGHVGPKPTKPNQGGLTLPAFLSKRIGRSGKGR